MPFERSMFRVIIYVGMTCSGIMNVHPCFAGPNSTLLKSSISACVFKTHFLHTHLTLSRSLIVSKKSCTERGRASIGIVCFAFLIANLDQSTGETR